MLYPSMNELVKKVDNRYMLVNLTARRARAIAIEAEENGIKLQEKPVKTALMDIMADRIVVDYDSPCGDVYAVASQPAPVVEAPKYPDEIAEENTEL